MSQRWKGLQCSFLFLTQKSPLVGQSAITWIGESGTAKHRLVAFETKKTYTHFGYDAEEDRSEAFIESKWGFSGDSHGSFDQASMLTLEKWSDTRYFHHGLGATSCTE